MAADHIDARVHRRLDQRADGILPSIDDSHDFASGPLPVDRCSVGVVVGGEQHQLVAGRHGISVEIGGDGRCQHDARQVVVGEHQGALDGAGREYRLPRANAMQTLTGTRGVHGWQVVGTSLQYGEEVVIVIAAHRGARQQGRVWARREFGDGVLHPVRSAPAVNGGSPAEQAAAELPLLVGDESAGAGSGGFQGGGEAGGTRADHQHVAVLIQLVVRVGIWSIRGFAETRRAAQKSFPHHPQAPWMHEGLVVEARRQKTAEGAKQTLRARSG